MAGKKQIKNEVKSSNSMLFYLAVALLILSLIIFSVNVLKVMQITGRATSGTVNITIETRTQINFTTDVIEFGTGSVSAGGPNATLDTGRRGANNLSGGNWTGNVAGLILENIGNQNVSLDLKAGLSAATFLGGTLPAYQWNITNVDIGSCNVTSGFVLGTNYDVNTTGSGTRVCDKFQYAANNDSIRIDIRIVVPSDSITGTRTDTLSTVATAV